MYISNRSSNFTKKQNDVALQIWSKASVSLLDIRHNLITSNEALRGYRLPASAFIYTSGGQAEVLLNDTAYHVERFGVFHASRGTELTIAPQCDWLEYYMVLYKALGQYDSKMGYNSLLDVVNPFQQQYGIVPANPIFLSELLRKMYEKWIGPTPLNLFYGKAAFYQLVYEIYEELDKGQPSALQPDIAAMAQHFMDSSYAQNISIQDMAKTFNVSYSHLHRVFTRKMGKSAQEYLTQIRLNACKDHLTQGRLTMYKIAKGTGFTDEQHLNRMFARHIGMTPSNYRKKMSINMRDSALGNIPSFEYNWENEVNQDELKKGATFMLKQTRSKVMIAAVLSIALLLSACSTGKPSEGNNVEATPTSTVASQVTDKKEAGTRIVKTNLGDVEMPTNPQKIVGINCYNAVKSLDANAVDMTKLDNLTYFTDNYDWEGLMALEPDLIIASYFSGAEEYIERCQQIAPTVTFDDSMTVEEKQIFIGQAIGKQDVAQAQVEEYQTLLEGTIQQLKDAGIYGSKVVILQYTSSGVMYAYGDKLGRGGDIIYKKLGFKATDLVQNQILDGEEFYLELSMETLPEYADADYIILMQRGDGLDTLYENGVWQSLDPVKEGHYFAIENDEYTSLFQTPSIVEVDKILNLYAEGFLEATK